jgi:hypothetical protein
MFRIPASALRAAAIAIPALLATSVALPASAQIGVSISFNNFHGRLAPYGTWSHHARWGDVWHPTRVDRNFRPYYSGYWVDTREYGWLWVSDESWGDIAYHYGRWVYDPHDGWLWVPGYVWGPSWVVWRSGGGNIGWFPMPPGDDYYGDGAYRGDYDNQYGYRDWYGPSFGNDQFLSLWIFVGENHFRDRHFHNYAVPQRDYGGFISQTRDSTNYVTVNKFVVNRSIDDARFKRDTKQTFQPVAASSVIRRNAPVTQAVVGRQVEQRERQQHPIPATIKPADQHGGVNLNSNVQQPIATQAPKIIGGRANGPDTSGPANPHLQTGQGAAITGTPPPKGNVTPKGQTERLNRGQTTTTTPAGNSGGPANTQADHGTAVTGTPPPKGNAGPQDQAGHSNRGPATTTTPAGSSGGPANSHTDHGTAVTNTPPPKGDAGPQDQADHGNRGPATTTTPAGNSGGPANTQADHGTQSSGSSQTPGASDHNGKGNVHDSQPPPQVQGNAPAAGGQGNTQDNRAGDNKHGNTKNSDNHKPADDNNKDGADHGPN